MKRRSFMAAIASVPLLGSIPPYFPAPKTPPKITSVSVETEFQLTTVFTDDIYAYKPEPPPTMKITASYDDGSIKVYVCNECSYSFEYSKDIAVCECNIVGNDLIVKMAYAREIDRTPVVTAAYKNIKEVHLGD